MERLQPFVLSVADLSIFDDLAQLLDAALSLIGETTRAQLTYVELYEEDDASHTPAFSRGTRCGLRDTDAVRVLVSRDIISRAITTGRTVSAPPACFHELSSVKQHELDAVLCVPFGNSYTAGVVYIQGRPAGCEFRVRDVSRVEFLARSFPSLVDGPLARELARRETLARQVARLYERRIHDSLERNAWNTSAVARELLVSRKRIRELVRRWRK